MNTLKSEFSENGTQICEGGHVVAVFDFLQDTKRFLDENYKGCYKSKSAPSGNGAIMIKSEGYAEFLKIIFKSVLASHLISVCASLDATELRLSLQLDTSVLDSDKEAGLLKVASASNFSAEITDKGIIAKFPILDASFSAFQSVSSSFVYNILKKIFLS